MKILTLNCQNGYHHNFNEFIEHLISQEEYDALLLQEVDEYTRRHLENQTHYRALFLSSLEECPRTVAVLVRNEYPFLDTVRINFSSNNKESSYLFGILIVKYEYGGKKYAVGSLHMPPHLQWINRIQSARKLSPILRQLVDHGFEFTIGGDWNSIFDFEHSFTRYIFTQKDFHPIIPDNPTYFTERIEPGHFWNNVTKSFLYNIFPTEILDFFITTEKNYELHVMPSIVSDHAPVVLKIHE